MIRVSDEVHAQILGWKHRFEKDKDRVVSMGFTIGTLMEWLSDPRVQKFIEDVRYPQAWES